MCFKKLEIFRICALFIAFFFNNICAEDFLQDYKISPKTFELKEHYVINNSRIFSNDLFPNISKNFLIAAIPQKAFTLTIKSYEVARIFERNGFELKTPFSEVTFEYQTPMQYKKMQDFINDEYVKFFNENCKNSIEILKIFVKAQSSESANILLNSETLKMSIKFEIFGKNFVKKNSGVLIAQIDNKKYFFEYEILANLNIFQTDQNLSAGADFSESNISKTKINFQNLSSLPACENELKFSSAKQYLAKNTPIYQNNVRPSVLVKKGQMIKASSFENGFFLETLLEAQQNGHFGDVIKAKNPESGKIINVRVVAKGAAKLI